MSTLLSPLVFVLSLLPLAGLAVDVAHGSLGANPVETLTHHTGQWALRFLLFTLLCTPLRGVLKWGWPLRVRRMLGLFSFFYACLHFTLYLWLDQFFNWRDIAVDIAQRPYITLGFVAFLLLVPLAATSNRWMISRLKARWKTLHRLVYPIGLLTILHYLWLTKADLLEPAIYLLILIALLFYRLVASISKKPY